MAAGELEPWRDRALCKGKPQNIWYPDRDAAHHPYGEARTWCNVCPVQPECLKYALESREREGMWGGKSPTERRELLKRRTRDCRWCGAEFLLDPTCGNPSWYCSKSCRTASRRKIHRESLARRLPGTMKARGHGSWTKVNEGCKCNSCRAFVREDSQRRRSAA